MTTRSVRAPLAAVIALLLPLALVACEEQGVPAVPAPDTAVATDTAKAGASTDAATADAAKTSDPAKNGDAAAADSAKVEDKAASTDGDDAKAPKDGNADPKPGAATDAKTAAGEPKTKPEAEPEPTVGEKKTEGSYAAWLQSSGKYGVDKPGSVVAVVTAQGEYHCNEKYPYKFKLNSPPAGVSYGADTVRGASISQKRASLSIPFTASSAGAKTISGTFYFSVCNEDTCQIKKQPMSVTVNVE